MSKNSNTYYLLVLNKRWVPIGEKSFRQFFTESAWQVLKKIIDSAKEDALKSLKIKDSYGKDYTIEEFLTEIQSLTIMEN